MSNLSLLSGRKVQMLSQDKDVKGDCGEAATPGCYCFAGALFVSFGAAFDDEGKRLEEL
jgi:hypothetical protein